MELAQASTTGDLARVRRLLADGADVNARDKAGRTALFLAVGHGHTEVVQCLLEAGADPQVEAAARIQSLALEADALALASHDGNLACVKLLLQAGADPARSEFFGSPAVVEAAKEGNAQLLRELLRKPKAIAESVLRDTLAAAIERKNEEAALMVLESKVKVRGRREGEFLCGAVIAKMEKVVRELLKAGVPASAQHELGYSALQLAKGRGREKIRKLLQEGLAPAPSGEQGEALVRAAAKGETSTVRRLIEAGVAVDARDVHGFTALMRAADARRLPVMKALLDAGADPNVHGPKGLSRSSDFFINWDLKFETPLTAALRVGYLPAVALLLQAGADPNAAGCDKVVYQYLSHKSPARVPFVEALLNAGLDPNVCWPGLRVSILETAAQNGFTGLVDKLIQAGARLRTSQERDRAISSALQARHPKAAVSLIQAGLAPGLKGTIKAEALIVAAHDGFDEVVRLLVQHGINVNRRAEVSFEGKGLVKGGTALMAAAWRGRTSTVELLLAAGADPDLKDADGRTALHWAQRHPAVRIRKQICRSLEEAKAKQRC